MLRFHHIAIQTQDVDNSVRWYEQFFGGRFSWSLATFSELTHSRLPGITRLVEMILGDIRFHLFERSGGRGAARPGESFVQFQHLCLTVESAEELRECRRRWVELYASGRYQFAFDDQATEIVTDASQIQTFYALDVNGLELEFAYFPSRS